MPYIYKAKPKEYSHVCSPPFIPWNVRTDPPDIQGGADNSGTIWVCKICDRMWEADGHYGWMQCSNRKRKHWERIYLQLLMARVPDGEYPNV